MNLSAVIFMLLTFLGAVLLSVRMFDTNPERLEPERDADGLEKPLTRFHKPGRLTKSDLPPILAITLIAALLAFLCQIRRRRERAQLLFGQREPLRCQLRWIELTQLYQC